MNPAMLLAASAGSELLAQVITTMITFAIVVVIIKMFALEPVTGLLDERKKRVADQFDDIDRQLAEANAMMKDYEERLKRIDDEARERHNKAVDEGRKMAANLIEKARQDAEEITTKAKASMEMELEKARLDLRRETVEMTLAATGKLLSVNLDDSKQRELVTGFINDLEKRANS